jgi:uncharacterized membrane protein YeaQ/YmgE (transglycosylase-associated protein family)
MTVNTFLILFSLIASGAGGLLAGMYRPGWSLSKLGDVCLGVVGAKLGSQLWGMIGVAAGNSHEFSFWGFTGELLAGFVGALTLLAVIFQFKNLFSK